MNDSQHDAQYSFIHSRFNDWRWRAAIFNVCCIRHNKFIRWICWQWVAFNATAALFVVELETSAISLEFKNAGHTATWHLLLYTNLRRSFGYFYGNVHRIESPKISVFSAYGLLGGAKLLLAPPEKRLLCGIITACVALFTVFTLGWARTNCFQSGHMKAWAGGRGWGTLFDW